MPLTVTVAPPSDDMLPPEDAEILVIAVTAVVDRTGTTAGVAKVTSLP